MKIVAECMSKIAEKEHFLANSRRKAKSFSNQIANLISFSPEAKIAQHVSRVKIQRSKVRRDRCPNFRIYI